MNPALSRRAGVRRPVVALLAAVAVFAGVSVSPVPAFARDVSGVKLVAVTHTSFTVTLDKYGTGWKYKLYASTRKPDVYYSHLSKAPYTSSLVSRPRMTVANLKYSTGVYWWRVQAIKGQYSHTSPIYSVGLVPNVPTALAVATAADKGLSLTWGSGATTGYQVQQATDAAFTQGLRTYTTRGGGRQLTPYGLVAGTTYFFRIRGVNNGTLSPWSAANPPVSATAVANEQAVRVASFNLLTLDHDGQTDGPGSEVVAKWKGERDVAAAAYVKAVMPDVLGVQEGAAWTSACKYPATGIRQVDDLVAALHSAGLSQYQLGQTEVQPCHSGWMRSGVYVVYDASRWSIADDSCDQMLCKNFDLGAVSSSSGSAHRYAAWEILQNRQTGARFLFVSPHTVVGSGSDADQRRQSETASMIDQARALAHAQGDIPVVYAGDFNSNELHKPDGPEVATRNAGVADALLVAQSLTNNRYNSANGYLRKPPADGHSIDHVYAEPGVGVARWALYLRLSSGKFAGTIPADHNLLYSDLTLPY